MLYLEHTDAFPEEGVVEKHQGERQTVFQSLQSRVGLFCLRFI